jgi:hypothetical protein
MRRGGEAYLPAEEVVETLKYYWGDGGTGRAGGRGRDEVPGGRLAIWELGREEAKWVIWIC